MPAEPQLGQDVDAELTIEQTRDALPAGQERLFGIDERAVHEKLVEDRFLRVEHDDVDVAERDPCRVETEPDGPSREEVRVFDAIEPLFLDGRHDLAVAQQHRRPIVRRISEPDLVGLAGPDSSVPPEHQHRVPTPIAELKFRATYTVKM